MNSIFRNFDLFGKPVSFNFNGQVKSRSAIGACFSLLFIGFIGWALYEVGQDMVRKQDPKTIQSESYDDNPSPMVISPETFNFGFGLQHPISYAHYIDESIYTVEAYVFTQRRTIHENETVEVTQENIPLAVEQCNKEHFGNVGYRFETVELNELYCLKKDQPNMGEVKIQGVFESAYYADIVVEIKRCIPKLSKVPCAPNEVIDEMLGGWFAVYYKNFAIQPKNYTTPVIGYRDSYYTSLSPNSFKELTIWLSHVEVASDIGWLLKQEKVNDYIKFDYQREYLSFRRNITKVMDFVIKVGKITTRYERSYIKLQDILAKTNGFITAGILAALIFISPYSNIKFYERLINELFDIKTLERAINKKKPKVYGKSKKPQAKKIEKTILESNQQSKKLDFRDGSHEEKTNNFCSPSERQSFVETPIHKNFNNGIEQSNKGFSAISREPICKSGSADTNYEKGLGTDIEAKGLKLSDDQTHRSNAESIHHQNISDEKSHVNSEKEVLGAILSPSEGGFNTNRLIQKKPKMTPKLEIKVLDHYEPHASGDNIGTFEHLMIENRELNPFRAKQSFDEPPYINLKADKKLSTFNTKRDSDTQQKAGENMNQEIDGQGLIETRAEKLRSYLSQDSKKIRISFGEYVCSLFWKSESLKEKLGLLNEGVRRIQERLDIFNVLKKFREVDKLKLLLLENEQYVLFDTLPNPELSLKDHNSGGLRRMSSFSSNQLKEIKFVNEKRRSDLICVSYRNLKAKTKKTMIDEKLLEIYDNIVDF